MWLFCVVEYCGYKCPSKSYRDLTPPGPGPLDHWAIGLGREAEEKTLGQPTLRCKWEAVQVGSSAQGPDRPASNSKAGTDRITSAEPFGSS
ncbi:hypothetical protein THAOC_02654 [Thalassiosira oceanica]|uniref:Uncharacterized protein n=1 Tax=Thalassiosira oceanica TaxID=159749 RepID=K0TQ87_THAOC|nr:hypothetical protein THAOC_02654 [Thalassiosira oceanica]|eukprot:EJK75617.1 hypothetical protein THAOC_02654 [Thalassiosira oceanica]